MPHCSTWLLTAVLLLGCTGPFQSASTVSAKAAPYGLESTQFSYLSILGNPELLRGAKTYQKILAHKHSLSNGQLQRSLVYRGANLRLRRVLDKLLSGESVNVGVIGGSISWGHMVQKGVEDWFTLLSTWMNTTFPATKLSFKNGCVPATQSEYVSMCLKSFVDQEADLVFVEYATNDGYIDGPIHNAPVLAFERLLRKLLQLKRTPAVVLMEFLATDVKQKNLPFHATAEDQYGVLAQYYGIPWLSFRNLVWHGLWSDQPGFSRNDIFYVEDERHPTPLGHRYMADMAINLLQQTYIDTWLVPLDGSVLPGHPLAKVPAPLFPGNFESTNLACIVGEDFPAVVVQSKDWQWVNEGTAAKPKWGFVSWKVGASLVVKVDTRAALVTDLTPRNSSSVSISRSSRSVAGPSKAGGAVQQLSTGTSQSSEATTAAGASPHDMIIWVGYLRSWRHMGSATISCIQGCDCTSIFVDGMHEQSNTQQFMAKLFSTQAEECLVEVKINEWARSTYHKFKVTGVMVTRRIDYLAHGDFTDQVLMDAMAPQNEDAASEGQKGHLPNG